MWSAILHRPKRLGKDGLEKKGDVSAQPSAAASKKSRPSASSRPREDSESECSERRKPATRGKNSVTNSSTSSKVLGSIGDWMVDRNVNRDARPVLSESRESLRDDPNGKSSGRRSGEKKTRKSTAATREECSESSSTPYAVTLAHHQRQVQSGPKKSRKVELMKDDTISASSRSKEDANEETDVQLYGGKPKTTDWMETIEEGGAVSTCPIQQQLPTLPKLLRPTPVRSSLKKRSLSFVDPPSPIPPTPTSAWSDTSEIPGSTPGDHDPLTDHGSRAQSVIESPATVRFGSATVHRVEVGTDRRLRPVGKKHKTKSGLPYLAPLDPAKKPTIRPLASPKKVKRHLHNQAAMGRYWQRMENEEAKLRAEAQWMAKEDAEKYCLEPSSTSPIPSVSKHDEDDQETPMDEQSRGVKENVKKKKCSTIDNQKEVKSTPKPGEVREAKTVRVKSSKRESKSKSEARSRTDGKYSKEARHRKGTKDKKDVKLDVRSMAPETLPPHVSSSTGGKQKRSKEPPDGTDKSTSLGTKQSTEERRTQSPALAPAKTTSPAEAIIEQKPVTKRTVNWDAVPPKEPEDHSKTVNVQTSARPEARDCGQSEGKTQSLPSTVTSANIGGKQAEATVETECMHDADKEKRPKAEEVKATKATTAVAGSKSDSKLQQAREEKIDRSSENDKRKASRIANSGKLVSQAVKPQVVKGKQALVTAVVTKRAEMKDSRVLGEGMTDGSRKDKRNMSSVPAVPR